MGATCRESMADSGIEDLFQSGLYTPIETTAQRLLSLLHHRSFCFFQKKKEERMVRWGIPYLQLAVTAIDHIHDPVKCQRCLCDIGGHDHLSGPCTVFRTRHLVA